MLVLNMKPEMNTVVDMEVCWEYRTYFVKETEIKEERQLSNY